MATSPSSFRWTSALGVSVALFLAWGVIWAVGLVGILALFWNGFPPWLMFSPEVDAALFGAPPETIRAQQPAAAEIQWFLSHLMALVIACAGVAIASIAWFGLRRGERWAYWTLVASFVPILLLYPYAVARYARQAPIGFWDLQPFVTIPAVIVPIAIVLGWIGLPRPNGRSASPA